MDDSSSVSSEPRTGAGGAQADSSTRGFLFADLRDYTSFVATHGAAAAADLLVRYRALVRDAIKRFEGAEIRTEGDSFYVVFGSVSAAVRCGLTIAEAASAASAERPDLPIRVGIGIHAGETIETPEGYVGSPVNIAARICSAAAAGEVLVSDTVRALTQTMLPVRFAPRGRRQLKGVPEPIALFAVVQVPAAEGIWPGGAVGRWRGRRWVLVAGGVGLALGLAAIGWFALGISTPAGLPPGPWKIGLSLPLSGFFAEVTEPFRLAAELAVEDAKAIGGIGGARLELDIRDNADPGGDESPTKGAGNATDLVADPKVLAMVGPFISAVAEAQIPITNAAGLLQCSPSATDASLTKPGSGAIDLRSANPERINFVRLAAVADIEALGAASFAFNELGAQSALVIDDTQFPGRLVADAFEQAFGELGGQVVRRALNPGADPLSVLQPLDEAPDAPTLVYFGGFTFSGAAELRRAMIDAGHLDVDFLSWEGILDYVAGPTSFVEEAGEAAIGTYASRPSVGTVRADFMQRFRAAYDTAPEGPIVEYVAASYACTEVILESLRRVAEERPAAERLREAVRSYAVDPAHRFQTVVGDVSFDANGDNTHQFVTIYRVIASVPNDPGNWAIAKQLDFGPSP